ncbi:MAG: ribosome small subunit-dependent GTPase A [Candidatus Pelethousia sp.]|nr:ribosome small subunit-dependent GTPase A [Candidatus Pelethousia sp.]
MEGRILKGIGSFYTLQCGADSYVCKARGRFRKEGLTPVPGDWATFETSADGKGYLLEIHPRKNLLLRPAVANVDQLFIMLAASRPQMDLLLCDKLLIQCGKLSIAPILLCNKCDEAEARACEALIAQYKPAGYPVLVVSAKTGEGVGAVRAALEGCVSCFAGQSAVGKTSLLNALLPGIGQEVGDLSRKTERGRHTTRHAELFPAFDGAIVDTPGFSLLDMAQMEPWELCAFYPEMASLAGTCRFPECLHISEPGCAVKPLLQTGGLHPDRYERYRAFIEELKEMRKHRYD